MTGGMQILVTGGFGYVGTALVQELERRGINYLSVDKRYPPGSANQVSIDLRNDQQTADVIERYSPTVLVHCGTNSALAYRDNFLEAFREDAAALTNLLAQLSNRPGCRLISISSSYCYSALPTQNPVVEATPLQPSHSFGIAKAFFEQLAFRCHPNTVVFRLSSVFGPGNAVHPNAIFNLTQECLETGRLTIWGTGSRKMQYVYIGDVVAYLIEAFSLPAGLYNLGGNEYLSVAESAKIITSSLKGELVFLKDKSEGETLPFMDNAKLKRHGGDRITPFEVSLKEYLDFLQSESTSD